jgi:hypothetical protein
MLPRKLNAPLESGALTQELLGGTYLFFFLAVFFFALQPQQAFFFAFFFFAMLPTPFRKGLGRPFQQPHITL